VYVGILDAGCAHNLLLLAERVLELGLEEGSDDGQLKVDNVLFETLRVPQRDTNALAIYFCLEVFGGETRFLSDCGGRRRRRIRSLLLGEGESGAQEIDEGGLAAVLGADDEDAVTLLAE